MHVGEYPSDDQVVDFAIWMTMHRERVCLAQRADSGARRFPEDSFFLRTMGMAAWTPESTGRGLLTRTRLNTLRTT